MIYSLIKSWNKYVMNLSEIDNTVYLLKSLSNAQIYPNSTWLNSYIILSSLFTGQIVKKIEKILVEYIAQFFLLNHFAMTICTPIQLS